MEILVGVDLKLKPEEQAKRLSHGPPKATNSREYRRYLFLGMTIRAGIVRFAQVQLEARPELASGHLHTQPLLDFALGSLSTGWFWLAYPVIDNKDVSRMLLRKGANPNEEITDGSGATVWSSFLAEWSTRWPRWHVSREMIEELLENGADPFATVQLPEEEGGAGKGSVEQALERRLPADDALFAKLAQKRKEAKRKGRFWRGLRRI